MFICALAMTGANSATTTLTFQDTSTTTTDLDLFLDNVRVTSSTATGPQITSQPQSLTVTQGSPATFNVTATDLLLPLLFSIVVFYPIWAIATTAARSFFVIHAAFLNGYFWESFVAAAKPVEGGR